MVERERERERERDAMTKRTERGRKRERDFNNYVNLLSLVSRELGRKTNCFEVRERHTEEERSMEAKREPLSFSAPG